MAARAATLVVATLVGLTVGCAGDTVEPSPAVAEPTTASPTRAPAVAAPDQVRTSNEVPTIDALVDIGLTTGQAECFVRVIDPDGNGEIETEEQFMDAFSTCVQ